MKATLRYLVILLGITVYGHAQAQKTSPGYKLDFKIEGLKDTTVLLGFYYGESTLAKDTATVNAKGEFSFAGTTELPRGVYFLAIDKSKAFELLVTRNQHFKMETKVADYVKNMKVTGDPDNQLFFESMKFNADRHEEAEPYINVLRDSTATEEAKKTAREAYNKINDIVMKYQSDMIEKHPNTMTAKILKANLPITLPDPPKKADGSIDSTYQLHWYREHFFDNFDLADDAMIRMPRPVYSEKVNEYLDRLYAPHPDTVITAIESILAKAKSNPEAYKYVIYLCLLKYQNPEIMGLDAVMVYLNDRYFATGEMNYWANEKMRKNLQENADRLRKSLVGHTAANLIMQDLTLKPRSMYDIKNKYTILFIFDPDCGHCRKETPKLVQFYNKNKQKFDLEVFAVSTDTSLAKMRDFIKEMDMHWITVNGPRTYVGPYSELYDAQTTPSLYIIDNKKKIIAKKLPVDKLEEFFTNYEKFMNKGS